MAEVVFKLYFENNEPGSFRFFPQKIQDNSTTAQINEIVSRMQEEKRIFYTDFVKTLKEKGLNTKNNRDFIEQNILLVQKHMRLHLRSLKMLR